MFEWIIFNKEFINKKGQEFDNREKTILYLENKLKAIEQITELY